MSNLPKSTTTKQQVQQTAALPPHSVEAEQAFLACVLNDGAGLLDELTTLKPEHFYIVKHGWAYQAFRNLHSRGEHIEILTGQAELESMGKSKEIDDRLFLLKVANAPDVKYTSGAFYANIIIEAARQRKGMALAAQLYNASNDGDILEANRIIAQISELKPGITQAKPRFKVLATEDVLTLPKPTWLYPGEIPANALITLTGPSGNGKTFLCVDYALTIAQQHSVLYVAAERPYAAMMRGKAWLDHYKATNPEVSDVNLVWVAEPVIVTNPDDVQAIIQVAKNLKVELIIFDTFSRCAEGIVESDTSEMKRAMSIFDHIRGESGAAVMVVHHTGWEGTRERDGSPMRDYAEVAILVTKELHGKTITISCNKMSSADEFESRAMTIIPVGEQLADEAFGPACVIPSDQVSQNDGELTPNALKVLLYLDKPMCGEDGATWTELLNGCGMGRQSLSDALQQLQAKSYVLKAGATKGAHYCITPSGKEIAQDKSRVQSKSKTVQTDRQRLVSPSPKPYGFGLRPSTWTDKDLDIEKAGNPDGERVPYLQRKPDSTEEGVL